MERPNREELLAIKRSEFGYGELLARAEAKMAAVEAARASLLPGMPDRGEVERRLVAVREKLYARAPVAD